MDGERRMSEYRCSQCGATYLFDEYNSLDKVPVDPDDPDPMNGQGYERVCECGARMHSDKWSLRETIDTDDGEIAVSTVALIIPHGLNHDQWYETCLFHDGGSRVTDRYHTQDEAEDGHDHRVEQVRSGEYRFVPTGQQIQMEDA